MDMKTQSPVIYTRRAESEMIKIMMDKMASAQDTLTTLCEQCDYKAKNDSAVKSHVTKKHLISQIDGHEDPVASDIH
jgi:hypothetical protein